MPNGRKNDYEFLPGKRKNEIKRMLREIIIKLIKEKNIYRKPKRKWNPVNEHAKRPHPKRKKMEKKKEREEKK